MRVCWLSASPSRNPGVTTGSPGLSLPAARALLLFPPGGHTRTFLTQTTAHRPSSQPRRLHPRLNQARGQVSGLGGAPGWTLPSLRPRPLGKRPAASPGPEEESRGLVQPTQAKLTAAVFLGMHLLQRRDPLQPCQATLEPHPSAPRNAPSAPSRAEPRGRLFTGYGGDGTDGT